MTRATLAPVLLIVGTPEHPSLHHPFVPWVAECPVCGSLALAGAKGDLPAGCPRCEDELDEGQSAA